MIDLRYTLEGARNAIGQFERWSHRLDYEQRVAVGVQLAAIRDAIRAEAPVGEGSDTGEHVRDTIRMRVMSTGAGTVEGEVYAAGARSWLLPLIIEGTQPHIIRARNHSRLRIEARTGSTDGAGVYFPIEVDHPGTAPNDFVSRATEPRIGEMLTYFRQIAQRVIVG